ncbi:MAG: DUF389 domain-containing protein [Acidobacteriota bacterium]
MHVLTVITRKPGAIRLARLGYRVARALEARLVILCVESGERDGEPVSMAPSEPVPEGASETVAALCSEFEREHEDELLAEEGEPQPERILPAPQVEIRWLRAPRRLQAVLAQIKAVEADYLVAAKWQPRAREVSLARKLFTSAPCHMILARLGESGAKQCQRILVPTAGGPHASVALRLGERLASAEEGEVVALHVGSDAGELPKAVGRRILDKAVAEAGVNDSRFVQRRVELSDDRFATIQSVASEGFDLLLLGESNAGSLRRRLFGTVPQSLLTGEEGLQVAVVRREWKLLHRFRRRLGRWLDLTIPQMARGERVALYEKLQAGSEWTFDFMALIALSTAIAALGLLQNSGAVVIGAMLVAPLMTPILGAGLALVQGNFPLLRTALRAIVFGYLIALLIGLVLGMLFPISQLTPELAARGGPTLLDMGVAFLSGIAAAFCLGRPGLLAALPGVAIAAALVPPIATTGVCLALGERGNAQGSALLFGTNVVAIILGAAGSLYAIGVRGRSGASAHQLWVRYSFLILLLGLGALALPLSRGLLAYLGSATEIPPTLEARLEEGVQTIPGARVLRLESRREKRVRVLEIELAATRPLNADEAAALTRLAREELGSEQVVRIETRLVTEDLP